MLCIRPPTKGGREGGYRSTSAEGRLRPNHRGLVRRGRSSRDSYQLPQGKRKANLDGIETGARPTAQPLTTESSFSTGK